MGGGRVFLDDEDACGDAADCELLVAFGSGRCCLDTGDLCVWWSCAEVRKELVDGCWRALDVRLDGAIGAVADPAEHAELVGAVGGGVAEADALDVAVDRDAEGCLLRRHSLHRAPQVGGDIGGEGCHCPIEIVEGLLEG